MIKVYKIINLKTNYVFKEEYLFKSDAQYALNLLDHRYIHEVYEDERHKLRSQSVNLEALRDSRKNDRLTIHMPQENQGTLIGLINHQKEMKPVVYDVQSKIWRAIVLQDAVA